MAVVVGGRVIGPFGARRLLAVAGDDTSTRYQANGLTGTGSQVLTQDSPGVGGTAEEGDAFGFALTAADFDNDAFADLAVGAPFAALSPIWLWPAMASIRPGAPAA